MKKDEQEWPLGTGGQTFRASLVSQWVKILLQRGVHRRCPLDIFCPMDSHKESDKTDQLSMRATASLCKVPVILKTRRLYQNVYQYIISFIEKVFLWTVSAGLLWDIIGLHSDASYLSCHGPGFGGRAAGPSARLWHWRHCADIWDQLLHTALCCGLSCMWCVVVLAPFFSFYTLLTHCHWHLPGSCENENCVQGWPVSWNLGWRWGREQWFWLWMTGLQ